MDLSRHFILLNGEPKTLQIDSIIRNGASGYRVRFKNNGKSYNYGMDKVVWLSNPEWLDPTNSHVFIGGSKQNDIKEIWKFSCGTNCYWRITHLNGYVQEGDESKIVAVTSCLAEETSRDTLAYLKNVAIINPLGKDRDHEGILANIYAQVEFVDTKSAAACYLNPKAHKSKCLTHGDLIYPFGCNASQKKAVAAAFEHQMSVIQGPPGTGKTQNEEKPEPTNWFSKWKEKIKWWWMKWICRHRLHIVSLFDKNDLTPLIKELQTLYYQNRLEEIKHRIALIENRLALYDSKDLTETLTGISMSLFKSTLCTYYAKHVRMTFADTKDMRRYGKDFMQQYPVVLSTTFSARSCMFTDKPYDYIIMDEASQVSIDTGALALTCATNAVIVGDVLQLPNVVTDEDRQKLDAVMKQYHIAEGYDCAKNSFLQSVLDVTKDVPETLLREHYRCHPRIINFCNQKFYGGSLLIMTEDKSEENVLTAIRTVKGNHAVNHYNQREIDVVKEEVMPALKDYDSIGIISPYNNQVDAFNRQMVGTKAGTIHKYQGRENDAIIMSVVDNQITDFADDANMLNVAVSRAKKKFCLVMTGNEQEKHGNIMDLLDYIVYNNCAITESKLASIFDCLYEQYTKQRMSFIENHPQVSEYVSENLTYAMLNEIISSDSRFNVLKVLCHIPLRQVVKDTSFMSEEELRYAANYSTHLDFLIINRVTKLPVLAIETDGYSYHNDQTKQHQRDLMKDHILSCYGLPLLRLSTKGSGEKEKVFSMLQQLT